MATYLDAPRQNIVASDCYFGLRPETIAELSSPDVNGSLFSNSILIDSPHRDIKYPTDEHLCICQHSSSNCSPLLNTKPCIALCSSDDHHVPNPTSCCSINLINCLPAFQSQPGITNKYNAPLRTTAAIGPQREVLGGDRILVPLTNINIYSTEIQFYINDALDLRRPNLSALNMNQNNESTPGEESVSLMVNTFQTIVTSERAPEPESVVNLSSRPMSQNEIKILSLGKGFCPTPGEPNMGEIKSDLDRLHTKCRTKLFFDKLENDPQSKVRPPDTSRSSPEIGTAPPPSNTPYKDRRRTGGLSENLLKEKIFRKTTKWNPPRGPSTFETFAILNELALSKTPIRAPANQNLTIDDKRCLKDLSGDKTIVIKQADKGGALVLWDREAYIKEGLRQLSDPAFYKPLLTDPTDTHNEIINNFIDEIVESGSISNDVAVVLKATKARTPELYLLPKIHKKVTPTPGRLIVSGNGSPTEKISALVDFIMKPYVPLISSYVRDSSHVLEQLRNISGLSRDTLLVSLDVTSLYTNIPNEEGITACHSFLQQHRKPWSILEPEISNEQIMTLLRFVLTLNNFRFNDRHYLQVGGTAMGTRVAPTFTNIYMDSFERQHVYVYTPRPRLWLRFIDDILLVWDHGMDALREFITNLNNRHPNIKFSEEISYSEVSFLDISISKDPSGKLRTDLFTKSTDANNYLHYSSAHTKSCKDGIPYGQFLRIKRICSEESDFLKRCAQKALHMKRRGYPTELLVQAFSSACRVSRNDLLTKKSRVEEDAPIPIIGVTTFHPTCRAFSRCIRENWPVLGRSTTTDGLFNSRLIVAYRRPENLGDLLIRAKLPQLGSKPRPSSVPNGSARCTTRCCTHCLRLDRSGRITSHTTEGNTKGDTSVARHFNTKPHRGVPDVRTHVLEFVNSHPNKKETRTIRDTLELKWIHRLRTVFPSGMNVMDTRFSTV